MVQSRVLRLVPIFKYIYIYFLKEHEREKNERKAADWRKVTSGIWVVTHSSAGERLGYVHDQSFLQAECCASSPVFSQHVTSHLRVSAALQPRGLCVRRDPADADSMLHVHVNAEVCAGSNILCIITSHTPQSPARDEPRRRETKKRVSATHQAANLRGQRRATSGRRFPGGGSYSYICICSSRLIKCGTSAAAFLNVCFDPTHAGGELGLAWSN